VKKSVGLAVVNSSNIISQIPNHRNHDIFWNFKWLYVAYVGFRYASLMPEKMQMQNGKVQ